MWIWILLATFLAIILYGSRIYIFDKMYNLPPGPAPLPFIGSLRPSFEKIPLWKVMRNFSEKYGLVFTFYFGQTRFIVLNEAQLIRDTIGQASKGFNDRVDIYFPGQERVPRGIVVSSQEQWRRHRRFGMRAMRDFGMGKDAMVTMIQDEVLFLLPAIRDYNGRPFHPKKLINNSVSNVICSLVFGKRFSYDNAAFHEIMQRIDEFLTGSVITNLVFFLFPFLSYIVDGPQAVKYMSLHKTVKNYLLEATKEHRADFSIDNIRDFPDIFIQAEMQDDAIDFESFSIIMTDMFVAGTETTSTALCWTLLYLATFPDIQKRCHEAIDDVIESDRLPNHKDRPRLVYIDAVMNEVLRHASFLPLSLFHSNLNANSNILGYDVPSCTAVMYNLKAVHHDSSYWEEPDKFIPGRWISDDGKLLSHSTHYFPFGLGPRVCLGESMARSEYFVFLVAMLHRFTFKLDRTVQLEPKKDGFITGPPDFQVCAESR